MTEAEFRAKYPHSTDDQVRLYLEAVAADAARVPEPDIPMPMITVPRQSISNGHVLTSYTAPYLEEAPPEWQWSGDLRDILAAKGCAVPDLSDDDMLAYFFDAKEFEARA